MSDGNLCNAQLLALENSAAEEESAAGMVLPLQHNLKRSIYEYCSPIAFNHNSPAFIAAEIASLHPEVSLETQSSSWFSNASNNCSPSIPHMDGSYDLAEVDGMDALQQSGYPMSTGAASPGAFSSVAMSRGNSTMSNIQFHHSPT
mgnify:CR=1 FL=1